MLTVYVTLSPLLTELRFGVKEYFGVESPPIADDVVIIRTSPRAPASFGPAPPPGAVPGVDASPPFPPNTD